MRHFGDSAQPYNSGADVATDGRFAPPLAQAEKTDNFAKFIHEQFSPANKYDLSASAYGGGDSARDQELERKSLRFILPPLSLQSETDLAKPAFDTGAHPLLAHLKKPEMKTGELSTLGNKAKSDPFSAENCYQTMTINPQDGTTKTITTLPDLSSTKIQTKNADGSSIAYTDGLGRTTSEKRYDPSGKLMIATQTEFGHGDNSAIPSRKIIKTAGETVEISMDSKGIVLQKIAVPYSDLHRNA